MVTIDKSILKILSMSLLDTKALNALPKVQRKKALKTIESYQRFMAVVEQLMAIDLLGDTNIEITAQRSSPSGMTELPNSNFYYTSKKIRP